ncbi:MAG: ion transporter [Psychrobium sp.]
MYESLKFNLNRLKNNKIFELSVVAVIIISALEIGAKTFELPDSAISITGVLDIFITVFFLFELTIRFIADEDKRNFFKKGWNIFDTLVVVISLIPINDSEMALLARLVRVFRVLRMVSVVPELRVLINSLIKALPQLGYVILLMFIIFYIYAAIGSFVFAQINPKLWGDIAISMLTLFRIMTFEDWTDYILLSFLVLYVDNRLFFGLHFLCQQKNRLYKLIASREEDSESRPSKRDKIRGGWDQPKYSC